MTDQERKAIRKAIRLIHHDNDYYGGMDILARLAGLRVKNVEVKLVTVADLCKDGKNRKFHVKE